MENNGADDATVSPRICFTPVENKTKETAIRYEKYNTLWTEFQLKYPSKEIDAEYVSQYFQYLVECGKEKQLWSFHSALSDLLLKKYKMELKDIQGYKLVKDTIKANMSKCTVQQAETLSDEVVKSILLYYPESGKMLMQKAFFCIGLFAAFRVDDLERLKRDSITFNESNRRVAIRLQQSKTGPCLQIIPGLSSDLPGCPYRIIKNFYDSSNQNCNVSSSVWRRYIDSSHTYSKQKVGINTLRNWIKDILSFPLVLELLPSDVQEEHRTGVKSQSNKGSRIGLNRYTGHSMRRTTATLLSSIESVTFTELQRIGRWSSPSTAQRYIDNNEASKARTVDKLLVSLNGKKAELNINSGEVEKVVIHSEKVVYINGNNNTINM